MKMFFSSIAIVIFFASAILAQSKYDLPKGAVVVETQSVKPQRSLVLWMKNPKKFSRQFAYEGYSCPEYTTGNSFSGKTNISLVNSQTGKIINTLPITNEDSDEFSVPYLIKRYYYKVPVVNAKKEGKPKILYLQDFNGDGKAYEFALYDALACMGLDTALFGYSENQDKVIQYSLQLNDNGKQETLYWADYLFSKKPVSNGYWKFDIDYRGRGGSLDKYEIHYDKEKEAFVGTLASTTSE